MTFTGMFATLAKTATIGATSANTNVKGLEIGLKNMPLKANAFFWNRTTQAAGALGTPPDLVAATAGGLNDNLYVYGIKLRGEAAGGWISIDLVKNSGDDRLSGPAVGCVVNVVCAAGTAKYAGFGGLIDVGYNAEIPDLGGFTPWGTFGYGSGRSSTHEAQNENFTVIASDFRPGVFNRKFSGGGAANLGSAYQNNATGSSADCARS